MNVTRAAIDEAHARIRDHVIDTPLTHSVTLSKLCGCTVLLKLENMQMTGSFKERGALARLQHLTAAERARGVIAASAGNHAQALAYHGAKLGISVKIVMPKDSPLVKLGSTRHWGADVILEGGSFDEAVSHSRDVAREERRTYIHPFNDPLVVTGQGTLAREILAHPLGQDIDALVVPVGGGGLIAGVARYVRSVQPGVKVFGVEEDSCPGMSASLTAGRVVPQAGSLGIADGIAVGQVAEDNLKAVQEDVDGVVTVSGEETANAILLLLEIEKILVEGAAATTIAALLNDRLPETNGKKVVAIISGGNIDVNLLSRIIAQGLSYDGRIARILTTLADRPGALEQLLGVFRSAGANVLEVDHYHFSNLAPIGRIKVAVTIETRNREHIHEIATLLEGKGYELVVS